jgi:CheY-like chemotaxis protein
MPRRVLDVGQCSADHWRISQTLSKHFDVEIQQAHSRKEAVEMAAAAPFDLILINRLLDADGSPGMPILQQLKSDPATTEVPVMLVSNYADAQEAAVKAGAAPGFGKAALGQPATIEALAAYLSQ